MAGFKNYLHNTNYLVQVFVLKERFAAEIYYLSGILTPQLCHNDPILVGGIFRMYTTPMNLK